MDPALEALIVSPLKKILQDISIRVHMHNCVKQETVKMTGHPRKS